MARSFRREEQSEQSLDPSLFTGELLSNYDEQRSEGYDEYFDPPLESKYECVFLACENRCRRAVDTDSAEVAFCVP